LSDLQNIPVEEIDVQVLKQAGVIGQAVKFVKVFKSGDLSRKVSLKGLTVSAGARSVIESVGGSIA